MLGFWRTALVPLPVLLSFAITARADTMLSTNGIFAATGTGAWSNTSFQGSSFAVPLSGSADVILGTFSHPLAPGASITGGGAPDFSLAITIPGSTEGQSSHTFCSISADRSTTRSAGEAATTSAPAEAA